MYTRNQRVIPIYIEDEVKTSYLDYAMSVIVGRALPDARDGLKPVHRRILYAMHQMGLTSHRPYRKSARVVGEVLGKYHPHGDVAVYDTLVRMAQDFSTRYLLVDGQGNFGSIDGDPPAAMRYTEVRLSPLAQEMLLDIDKETVDFTLNFDESLKEPRVLPALLPNLLVNGSSGIAVGMATNFPPHNLGEVVDGVIALIDNPDITIEELNQIISGPDFPTGGFILGRKGIQEVYTKGRGLIKLRARTAVERNRTGRESIIVTEIPYQVNKASLLESIASLIQGKKIEGIHDLRDESDKDGMRIVLELKRDADAQVILNQLFRYTSLQTTMGIILLALVDGMPRQLNLKEVLTVYLEHRKEIVTRRTQYELKKAERRAHILEGLRIALDNLDAVIKTIRSSSNGPAAKKALMEKFNLSEIQAQAILDMKLERLTRLERDKIKEEYLKLIKEITRLRTILGNIQHVLNIIREELLQLKRKYADPRRTEIVEDMGELGIEDLIAAEPMVITISHAGYIKRQPVSGYRRQGRGGKGLTATGLKEEDFIEHLFIASTHEYILCFTDKGRVHWIKVYDIPQAGRLSKGKAIVNLLSLGPQERITAFLHVKSFDDPNSYLVMCTQKGVVKKTPLKAYGHPRVGGIIAINLDEGDRLIKVNLTTGDMDLLLATAHGKAIRFHETQVRPMGRLARGVIGITLSPKDRVVSMEVVEPGSSLLVVTINGYGKRTNFSLYRCQNRGGKGIINIRTEGRNGDVVGVNAVKDGDEVMMITGAGKIIRIPVTPIKEISRNTRGVRLISLNEGDRVVGLAKVVAEEEKEEKEENAGNGGLDRQEG